MSRTATIDKKGKGKGGGKDTHESAAKPHLTWIIKRKPEHEAREQLSRDALADLVQVSIVRSTSDSLSFVAKFHSATGFLEFHRLRKAYFAFREVRPDSPLHNALAQHKRKNKNTTHTGRQKTGRREIHNE